MEDIIRKIISIDRSALEIIERNEEHNRVMEEIARNEIEQKKEATLRKVREEAQCLYERLVEDASKKAEVIQKRGEENNRRLLKRYEAVKADLEDALFNRIFETAWEKDDAL